MSEPRAYRPEDLPAVAAIYRAAIEQFATELYTPEQIDAWARYVDDTSVIGGLMDAGFGLVIESEGAIEAFALLEPPGYVSLLYSRVSRKGHSTRLLAALEAEARRLGAHRTHTAASLISHPLFLRHGYVVDHPERVNRNGVMFDRYQMSKRLV